MTNKEKAIERLKKVMEIIENRDELYSSDRWEISSHVNFVINMLENSL